MNTQTSTTKVAVIGLGNIGEAIATNLTKGNHPVILASRDPEKSKALANKLGNLAAAEETAAAIKAADIIIPAIYFNSLKEFFQTYSTELEGKTIIDVSNPIAPDGKGGFRKIIGPDESAGKILSGLIPKNAKLVKTFGTLGAASLLHESFAVPQKKVLFYATDSTNCNPQVEALISAAGFDPLHIGGMDQAIRIEVFGDLHEFGALGKTVTLEEAESIIIKSH